MDKGRACGECRSERLSMTEDSVCPKAPGEMDSDELIERCVNVALQASTRRPRGVGINASQSHSVSLDLDVSDRQTLFGFQVKQLSFQQVGE